jgi:hypothetical protein
MQQYSRAGGNKKFITVLFMLASVTGLVMACTQFKTNGGVDRLTGSDKIRFESVFKTAQIIGEGTDFMTVKCDIDRSLADRFNLYALVLDENRHPLRKVSGYTLDPEIKDKDHLWFFFFLYDPAKSRPSSLKSRYIRFTVVKQQKVEMKHVVKISKTWGSRGKAKIFDLPSPPDHIPGFLLLKDYRFLAEGDFRSPQGYYVRGTVNGRKGRWTHFTAASGILGDEDSFVKNILPVDIGWLELKTGSSHSMKDAVSPAAPYVKGWWDGKGNFHPRPLKIFGLK